MNKILLIAAAGALGTLARYGLSGVVQKLGGPSFPWGTLSVNIIGCFFFAFIWSMAEARILITPETRIIVLTGFMGAFTTFSTYMFETGGYIQGAQWGMVVANLAAQNIIGGAALFAGLAAGRLL